MARIRTIKPEFFTDEDIAQMTPLARIAFEGLWCHADKAGRLEDRPSRLKVQILPYDDVLFESVLAEMVERRFIHRYRGADGKLYIQIRTFEKHQRPRTDEDESKIPAPKEDTDIDEFPSLLRDAAVTSQTLGKERKGTEEGKEKSVSSAAPSAPAEPASPSLLTFPVVGKGGPSWNLTDAQVSEWLELYPGVDILAEARQALAWVKANTGRRKTAAGMPRFLVNWFSRSVNRGGRSQARSAPVHRASQFAQRGPSDRDLELIAQYERTKAT